MRDQLKSSLLSKYSSGIETLNEQKSFKLEMLGSEVFGKMPKLSSSKKGKNKKEETKQEETPVVVTLTEPAVDEALDSPKEAPVEIFAFGEEPEAPEITIEEP